MLLLAGVSAFAQLGAPLSQYSSNQLAYNPACAGVDDVLAAHLSVRKQWVNLSGAPGLAGLNVHAPFRNDRHAWGVVFQHETWGPLSGNFAYGNYAYKLFFPESLLSFGLQVGAFNHVLDWNKIEHIKDPNDPVRDFGRTQNTSIDANIGAYYLTNHYYMGLSIKHLAPPKLTYDESTFSRGDWYPHMGTQFYWMSGAAFALDAAWSVRPEMFLRYVHHMPLTANVGVFGGYQHRYFFGVNYQTGQNMVSFSVRGFLTNNLRVGYSYDVYAGAVRSAQSGSHEISVTYQVLELSGKYKRAVGLVWL